MNVPHGHHPGGPPAGPYTPFPGPPAAHPGFSRSRALPVIVACGLAMGVFVGLVVVRGTGEAEGSSVSAAVNPAPDRQTPDKETPADPRPDATDPEARPAAGDPKPADLKPAAADPAAATNATADPEPAVAKAILTFNVSPKSAVVTIDGTKVVDGRAEVKLVEGKARVRLVAKASGYRSHDKSHLVTDDETISIELVKRSRRTDKEPSGPGGLIDLR